MHCIVNYEIGTGRAFDEDGDDIRLDFCFVDTVNKPEAGFVVIGGELHACRDFELFGNLLSFWVRPLSSWETLRDVVSVESPPKRNLQSVCDTFHRLIRIERETSQDLMVCETLCGMLNAVGYEIRIDFASTLVDLHPVGMTPEMLKQCLGVWGVEHIDRDHSGPIPPPSHMGAMMTEGLKNDE